MTIITVLGIIALVFLVIAVGLVWSISSRLDDLWEGLDYLARMESSRQKEKFKKPWEKEDTDG